MAIGFYQGATISLAMNSKTCDLSLMHTISLPLCICHTTSSGHHMFQSVSTCSILVCFCLHSPTINPVGAYPVR